MRRRNAGFSLVELMIAIGVASVLSTVLLAISLGFAADVFRSRATAELAVESHFVLQSIIEDIRLSDGVLAENTIEDSHAPDDNWTTDDALNRLVLSSPAIDTNRNIIYDQTTGLPYKNQFIYYIDDSTLYKRSLKDSAATGNVIVTTCPVSAASSSCPADRSLTSNITDMTLEFYDIDNAQTNNPSQARSVKVGLIMSRESFGKLISFNNSVQVTLRNF